VLVSVSISQKSCLVICQMPSLAPEQHWQDKIPVCSVTFHEYTAETRPVASVIRPGVKSVKLSSCRSGRRGPALAYYTPFLSAIRAFFPAKCNDRYPPPPPPPPFSL